MTANIMTSFASPTRIQRAIQKYERRIVADLQSLVRIRSVREEPAHGAPFGMGCRRALDAALEMAGGLGLKTACVDGCAGHAEIGEGAEIVGVLNHLDVVPEGGGWEEWAPPYEAVLRDGCVYGRGSSDNKGPAVVTIYCLRALADLGVPMRRRVRAILGTDEECGSEDMALYFAREPLPDIGFSPDIGYPVYNREKGMLCLRVYTPPDGLAGAAGRDAQAVPCACGRDAPAIAAGALGMPCLGSNAPPAVGRVLSMEAGVARNSVPDACVAFVRLAESATGAGAPAMAFIERARREGASAERLGGGSYKLTAKGRPAHGSKPDEGENAAARMLAALEPLYISDASPQGRFLSFAHERIGRETDGASLGVMCRDEHSGSLTVNMGTLSLDAGRGSLTLDIRYPVTARHDDVLSAAADAAAAYGLSTGEEKHSAPLFIPDGDPLVATLMGVYNRVTGASAKPLCTGGGTYARALGGRGVGFGPAFPGAPADNWHQANERCDIGRLMLHARVCVEAIAELATR